MIVSAVAGSRVKERDGSTWNAVLHVVVQPPALGEAEGEGEELCLGGELIRDEQAAGAQESLAVAQRHAHVACCMQHVGRKQDVVAPNAVPLGGSTRPHGMLIPSPHFACKRDGVHGERPHAAVTEDESLRILHAILKAGVLHGSAKQYDEALSGA